MKLNYFQYYNLEERLDIDKDSLRNLFYENSKKYHPDFYTLESDETQEDILSMSTINNEAYRTLIDDERRLKHLLEVKEAITANDKEELSEDFLMQMMEINEAIMDSQLGESDEEQMKSLRSEIDQLRKELKIDIEKIGGKSDLNEADIQKLKDYYYRTRYINRLKENLNKI